MRDLRASEMVADGISTGTDRAAEGESFQPAGSLEGGPRAGWITLVTVAAFGPYVTGSIRTDQIVVYGLVLLLTPFLLSRLGRASTAIAFVLALWSVLLTVSLIVSHPNRTAYEDGQVLANAENLAMPIAAVLVTSLLVTDANRRAILRRVAAVAVLAMSANAIVAVLQFWGILPPETLSSWWVGDGVTELSTAERATTLGRFTGIVGQPVVAGLLYSVAVLNAIYLFRPRTVWLTATLGLLAVGGVLTVSKAFLFIGIPIAGWQLMRIGTRRGRTVVGIASLGIALYSAFVMGYFGDWQGLELLYQVVPGTGALQWSAYLGGRYGEGASTQPVIDAVLSTHAFFGYGASGLDVYTDSAWVQILVLAGLFGAVMLALALVAMWLGYFNRRESMDQSERQLLGGVLLVMSLGCFVHPALTANRLAVIAWILITLLLSYPVVDPRSGVAQGKRLGSRQRGLSLGHRPVRFVRAARVSRISAAAPHCSEAPEVVHRSAPGVAHDLPNERLRQLRARGRRRLQGAKL